MLHLPELREQRGLKRDALNAIVDKAAAEKRDLSDRENSAFEVGKAEIEKLNRDIANAEFLADTERRMDGQPVANADRRFETTCREFSLLRAIASQVPGLKVDAAREREISAELERRSGRAAQGVLVPMTVFEKRVVTTALPAGGPGSNIISTDLLAGQFIDILRVSMRTQALGARVLSGLTGNVDIPRLKASATGAWVAENAAITASDVQFDKVSLTPKHCGAITEVSRNMVLQSSPDVEQILRDDFAHLLAAALDKAAIKGGGTNEPVGILSTSGVTDVPTAAVGGPLTYANIIALIAAVAGANALTGSLGFLTNSKVLGKAATTLKSTADTSSSFIIDSPGAGTLAGFPLQVSENVPSDGTKSTGTNLSALIFGNFNDMLIAYWSAFDLLVNPYDSTAYPKGNLLLRGMLTADIAIRQPKSFAKISDIVTA